MNNETRKNLIDILQAAEEIQDFVRGMDFKTYQTPLQKGLSKEILKSLVKRLTGSNTQITICRKRYPNITA